MCCSNNSKFFFIDTLWARRTLDLLRRTDLSVQPTNLRISGRIKFQKDPTHRLKKQHCSQGWYSFSDRKFHRVQTWNWFGREKAEWTNHRIFISTKSPTFTSVLFLQGILCVSGWRGAAVLGCKHLSLAVLQHINPLNQQRRNTLTSLCFCNSLVLTAQSPPCSDGSFTQVWSTWLF